MRKGISKITATALLMLVALTIGVTLYSFIQSSTSAKTEAIKFGSRIGFASIEREYWRGDLVLYVANHGDRDLRLDKAYIRIQGRWVSVRSTLPSVIPPHSVRAIIVSTINVTPGYHELRITGPDGYVSAVVDPRGSALMDYLGLITPTATINSPVEPALGFLAKFYNIRGLKEVPSVSEILKLSNNRLLDERVVQRICFSTSVSNMPGWGLNQTVRFAAVFEGVIIVNERSVLKITAVSDDGIYVTVDGKVVINGWRLQPATRYEGSVVLKPGKHEIIVTYFQNYGAATLEVDFRVLPAELNTFSIISIIGKYYNTSNYNPAKPDYKKILNDELPTEFFSDTERTIDYTDHPYYGGKPWPFINAYKDVNCFAAHWVVTVRVNTPGIYRVDAVSDDGIIIMLDRGKQVVSDWSLHGPKSYREDIYLSKGIHRFDVVYYENYGIARASFRLSFVKAEPQASNLKWVATVYDLTNYNWASLNLEQLYEDVIQGRFPVVGTYEVTYIDFTDTPSYGGKPWFFSGHSTDYFAVVFRTKINVKDYSTLEVRVYTDDGTKVLIDGNVILDAWRLQPPHHYSSKTVLAPGKHEVTVVYFERGGIARLRVDLYLHTSAPIYAGKENVFTLIINDPSALPGSFRVTLLSVQGVIGEKTVHNIGVKQVITIAVRGASLPSEGAIVIWG